MKMVTKSGSARAVVARGAALVSTAAASAASAAASVVSAATSDAWAAAKTAAYFCISCVGNCDLKKALMDI